MDHHFKWCIMHHKFQPLDQSRMHNLMLDHHHQIPSAVTTLPSSPLVTTGGDSQLRQLSACLFSSSFPLSSFLFFPLSHASTTVMLRYQSFNSG